MKDMKGFGTSCLKVRVPKSMGGHFPGNLCGARSENYA